MNDTDEDYPWASQILSRKIAEKFDATPARDDAVTPEAAKLTDSDYDALSDALKLEPPTPDAPMYYVGGIDEVVQSIVTAHVLAALPALREAMAAEIVSDGPKHPYKPDETVRINAWSMGLHAAARTVRKATP